MATIPAALLRHTITVERHRGVWGQYEAPAPVRCFLARKLATAQGAAGVARVAQHTVVCLPDVDLPEGSRVTLSDGRVGYVEASTLHDAPGLPTPDHVEAAVVVAGSAGPAFGETVTVLRRVLRPQRDRYGADRYTTTPVPVAGCAVRALSSQETLTGGRDRVADSIEVVMPPGTVVQAVDRLVVRGLTYQVDGTPDPQTNNETGAAPGVRVVARRVTG